MIEIMVTEIANYDMVQILQKVEQGEQVVLSHNGMQFYITLNQKQNDDRQLAFDEFFKKMKGRLSSDYQFNRDELYDRP